MGVLSLILTLKFIEECDTGLARKVYDLSTKTPQDWPFMCVSVGFTLECMRALRRGDLYSRCNLRGSLLCGMKDFFASLYFDFYQRMHRAPSEHHALHLNRTKKMAGENKGVKAVLVDYDEYVVRSGAACEKGGVEAFTDMEEVEKKKKKQQQSLASDQNGGEEEEEDGMGGRAKGYAAAA